MKKLAIVFALLVPGVYSFSKAAGDNPEKIASLYLKAVMAKDYQKAKEFGTSNTQGFLDFMITMTGGEEIKVSQSEIRNLKCVVESDTTAVCTYLNFDKESNSETSQTLEMAKENGKWLVEQVKEDPQETDK